MKTLRTNWILCCAMTFFLTFPTIVRSQANNDGFPSILNIRDQAQSVFQITQKRLELLIPDIMEQTGFDMWIIACNEDNLDPVYQTMVPYEMWCPITQILVFYDKGPGNTVERLNISRTNLSGLFTDAWDYKSFETGQGESQWDCLERIVRERDPKKIGINTGDIQWAAGGLTVALFNQIKETIGKKYSDRLASSESLTTLWGMIMINDEIALMERAQAVSHAIIAEAYSTAVITPGVTTIDDLVYFYWQRVNDLGLDIGAHPKFRIKGRSPSDMEKYGKDDKIIRPGDFLFCDVVLKYMRYYTDHAEWAYVPKSGENDAPDSFKKLMAEGNRLQDIFCSEFREGLTGNEVLKSILAKAREQGIPGPMIYSHGIGYYLHEPGPLIGLPWEQKYIPGRGEVKVQYNSCYAAELSVAMPVPELEGTTFNLALEEVVWFSEKGMVFLDGRQTGFYLVK
jgi:hypothetical protein